MSPADCHILVLEDEPAVLELVLAALRSGGFLQLSASSSIAGARQCWHAQTGKFDVLLTDFSLPDGSAPDFINELLRAKPHLRVVVMTGYSEDALGLEGPAARAAKVLTKPFLPTELLCLMRAGVEEWAVD